MDVWFLICTSGQSSILIWLSTRLSTESLISLFNSNKLHYFGRLLFKLRVRGSNSRSQLLRVPSPRLMLRNRPETLGTHKITALPRFPYPNSGNGISHIAATTFNSSFRLLSLALPPASEVSSCTNPPTTFHTAAEKGGTRFVLLHWELLPLRHCTSLLQYPPATTHLHLKR